MKTEKCHFSESRSDSGLSVSSEKAGQLNLQLENNSYEDKISEEDDDQLAYLVNSVNILSAGIGNIKQNRWLGHFGLFLWILNNIIHFSMDFYEAKFVFHVSWASTVALFLVAFLFCSINAIKYSIPWFMRGLKKLSKDGRYPKTLRRLRTYFKVVRILIIPLSIAAAMGQFGCYAYDGALNLSFKVGSSTNYSAPREVIPKETMIILNVLRATSLVHVFYGFCFFLLIHLGIIYMIQSSMVEYTELMAKSLRETPVAISFSEAVNSFAARSRFVHCGSTYTTGVLTTLIVVSSTSFVLNAYNYLFLKKYAIYIWFALVPIITAVVPLVGAAWVTRHYQRYKLVVVNAWVDVPDDEDEEDEPEEDQESSRTSYSNSRIFRCTGSQDQDKSSLLEIGEVAKKHLKANEGAEDGKKNGNKRTGGIKESQSFSYKSCSQDGTRNKERNNSSYNECIQKRRSRSLSDLSFPVPNYSAVLPVSSSTSESAQMNASVPPKRSDKTCQKETRITVKKSKDFERPQNEITNCEQKKEEIRTSSKNSHVNGRSPTSQLFSGIAKTYSRWRAHVKTKRKFNFEKYITYLDCTLPTVGFSIGGVVITWDAVSGFCFLLFTLVGVFAQEAFFGD